MHYLFHKNWLVISQNIEYYVWKSSILIFKIDQLDVYETITIQCKETRNQKLIQQITTLVIFEMLSHLPASSRSRFTIPAICPEVERLDCQWPMLQLGKKRERREETALETSSWDTVLVPPGRNFDTRVSVINCPSIERRRHHHQLVYILVSVRPEGREHPPWEVEWQTIWRKAGKRE